MYAGNSSNLKKKKTGCQKDDEYYNYDDDIDAMESGAGKMHT